MSKRQVRRRPPPTPMPSSGVPRSGTSGCRGCDDLQAELDRTKAELKRLKDLVWTPHTEEFLEAVQIEAAHQRDRWGPKHDQVKTEEDWYWLMGWLVGKAVRPENQEKRLHHIVTTAAACLNWHRLAKEHPKEPKK